jgi:hypothetical protein
VFHVQAAGAAPSTATAATDPLSQRWRQEETPAPETPEIWAKPIPEKGAAIVLLNRGASPTTMSVAVSEGRGWWA